MESNPTSSSNSSIPDYSPALSAYSSSSSSSSSSSVSLDLETDDADPDLDSLTLDDWGYSHSRNRDGTETTSNRNNTQRGIGGDGGGSSSTSSRTMSSARGTSGPTHNINNSIQAEESEDEESYERKHRHGVSTPIANPNVSNQFKSIPSNGKNYHHPPNSTSKLNQTTTSPSNQTETATSLKTYSISPPTAPESQDSSNEQFDETFDPLDYVGKEEIDGEEEGEGIEGEGFDLQDDGEEDMHASGVPAARGWKLDPRKSETPEFRSKILSLFSKELKLKGWAAVDVPKTSPFYPLNPSLIHLKRVPGAFTNAVFFVSYGPSKETLEKLESGSSISPPPTVLLRVYGIGCEVLLSRRAELLILHTLSSLYEIGPHILGTFGNGRVEEFYECIPLTREGMRDLGDREESIIQGGSLLVRGKEGTSQWVARRMRELHEVPLDVMKTVLEQGDLKLPTEKGFGRGIENHIMASSHRPRKKRRERDFGRGVNNSSRDMLGGEALEGSSIRDSPGLMAPQDTSISAAAMGGAQAAQGQSETESQPMKGYSPHRNSSVASIASFDSLATSFNSQSSFSSSSSESLLASPPFGAKSFGNSGGITPMGMSTSVGSTSNGMDAGSYFSSKRDPSTWSNPQTDPTNSPYTFSSLAGGGSNGKSRTTGNRRGSNSSSGNPRGPYPGVWRRIKRWSREAAKVLALVENFCKTPEGAEACRQALALPPSASSPSQSGQQDPLKNGILTSENIENTRGNLNATLKCIAAIDLPQLVKQLDKFKDFTRRWEGKEGQSRRVFSHNDAQPGNLLIIKKGLDGLEKGNNNTAVGMPRMETSQSQASIDSTNVDSNPSPSPFLSGQDSQARSRSKTRLRKPPHHSLVVIDFEYASPNPRAYDIANHFHEWRADYHHPTHSWSLTHHGTFPNELERKRWLRAYVEQGRLLKLKSGGNITPPMMNESGRFNKRDQIPTDFSLPPSILSNASEQSSNKNSILENETTSTSQTSTSSPSINPIDSEEHRKALEKSNGRLPVSRNTSSANLEPGSKISKEKEDGLEERTSRLGIRGTIRAAASAAIHGHHSSKNSARNPSLSPSIHPLRSTTSGNEKSTNALVRLDHSIEKEVERLEREIRMWSPASHAVWGLWGIVFAREEIEVVLEKARQSVLNKSSSPEKETEKAEVELGSAESFDNLKYALGRIELFRLEIQELGVKV